MCLFGPKSFDISTFTTTLVQFSVSLLIVLSIVDISLRILFDQHRSWLLMPEDEILEKYRRSMVFVGGQYFAQREHFPNFPVCFFTTT